MPQLDSITNIGGNMRTRISNTQLRKSHRLGSCLAVLSLAIGFTVVTSTPANAVATTNPCEFGTLITVRGTEEPAGSNPTPSGRLWRTGGHGNQLSALAAEFRIRSPLPMYVASLNYPAGKASYPFSVATGRTNLVNELNSLAEQCRYPAFFLAGFSQGASVVLESLLKWNNQGAAPNLSAKAKNAIRAVVAFGDPNFAVKQAFNAPGAPTDRGGRLGQRNSNSNAELASYRYWGWPPGGSGQGWVYKIRSYCYPGDAFCNTANDSNYTIHNSYGKKSTMDARRWMEDMVNSF